jgi:hypothetical protein
MSVQGILFVYEIERYIVGESMPVMVNYTYGQDQNSSYGQLIPRLVTLRFDEQLTDISNRLLDPLFQHFSCRGKLNYLTTDYYGRCERCNQPNCNNC